MFSAIKIYKNNINLILADNLFLKKKKENHLLIQLLYDCIYVFVYTCKQKLIITKIFYFNTL